MIVVHCSTCGTVHLDRHEVKVTVFEPTTGFNLCFVCPDCVELVVIQCTPEVAAVLVDHGCQWSILTAQDVEPHLFGCPPLLKSDLDRFQLPCRRLRAAARRRAAHARPLTS